MTTAITAQERYLLDMHESVVRNGVKTFVEVGQSLAAIHEQRLYRETHSTFEAYVRDRFGMSATTAYRRMAALTAEPEEPTEPGDAASGELPVTAPPAGPAREEGGPLPSEPQVPAGDSEVPGAVHDLGDPPEPDVVDCLGNVVTKEEMKLVFTVGQQQIEDMISEARALKSRMTRLKGTPSGRHLVSQALSDLQNVINALEFAMPYCLVPEWVTDGRYRKAGFVTEDQWKALERTKR
jgi:hypothetical protein